MKLPIIKKLIRLKTVLSTQNTAKGLAEKGAGDSTLVWADRQTEGRGRLSRKWKSGKGGLYFSLILRPKASSSGLARLSIGTAEAAARALAAFGVETRVKRPNDVLASTRGAPFRKIGGILTEARSGGTGIEWLVIGVGLNLNNAPRLKRATSLKALTGRGHPPVKVLKRFLKEFNKTYKDFLHGR